VYTLSAVFCSNSYFLSLVVRLQPEAELHPVSALVCGRLVKKVSPDDGDALSFPVLLVALCVGPTVLIGHE